MNPSPPEDESPADALRRIMEASRARRRAEDPRLVGLAQSFRAAALGRFPGAEQVHEAAATMGLNIESVQGYKAGNIPELVRREQLRDAVGEEHMRRFQTILQTATSHAQNATEEIIDDGWGRTMDRNTDWTKEHFPILDFLDWMSSILIPENTELTHNGIFSIHKENVPLIDGGIIRAQIANSERLAAERKDPKLATNEFGVIRDRIEVMIDEIDAALKQPAPNFIDLRRRFLILMRHQMHFSAVLGAFGSWVYIKQQHEGALRRGIHWGEDEKTHRVQIGLSTYLTTVAFGERINQRIIV